METVSSAEISAIDPKKLPYQSDLNIAPNIMNALLQP
jgi:hypothetical protein